MGARLSLVIPAYNEAAGIGAAVAEADEALARLCEDYEVLVVDDGSTDGTSAAVAEAAKDRPHVRLLRHEANRGYGAALRTGFESARCDHVAFTDADCQFHLDDLSLLLARTGEAPVVVGYRIDRKDVWRRRFLSRGYNLLARALLGTTVRDVDCALKLFRREELRRILPESSGFFVNTEMLTRARQLGLKVAEVGVRHRPRLSGHSSVSLWEVPKMLRRLLPFWWAEATFAGTGAGSVSDGRGERPSLTLPALGFVLLLACLLFFARLRAPLLEPQEARYAEIPRQMLAEGRFVVPSLHEEDYLDKPPLLYWCVMGSYRLFGVSDWAARLVPGLAGVLTVLVTYLWGRRCFGARAGFCAAVLLTLTPEFVYRGRMLGFDVLLTLWVVASLAAAHVALLSPRLRWRWWLLAAVACGLGLLTKGPVALALVAPPLAAVVWLDRRLARIGGKGWIAFVGVAALVAAPWYAAVVWQRPDFAAEFFWRHNVTRFTAPFDHAKPVWYYLPGLALGLMPWTLLLPVLAAMLLSRSRRMARRRLGALGLALAASLWMVLFFSIAGCKRPSYLLPALPPLALALGWVVATRAPSWRLLAGGSRLAAGVAGVVLALGVGAALTAALLQVIRPADGFLMAGVGLVALVAYLAWRRASWAVAALTIAVVLFVGVRELLPAYNDQFAVRGQLRRQAGEGDLGRRPVVCYPMRYDSASFYLPNASVRTFGYGQKQELIAYLDEHPNTLVLIKSGPVYRDVVRDLPPDLRVRTGRQRGAVVVGRVVRVEAVQMAGR